jgi:ubiquinone biosynthesis protein COQ9
MSRNEGKPAMEKTDNGMKDAKDAILDAALAHVAFDGWSEATFRTAVSESSMAPGLAMALFPRGAIDLALAYHVRGDAVMAARMAETDLSKLRYSERVVAAIRFRLEAASDKEVVRRGTALFALPTHAADGARAIWGTADAIWTALGDTSRDLNWYTKRATLAGVYASTVLFWLGDESMGHEATWAFLDRRIEDVMRIEKVKAAFRNNPIGKALLAGPMKVLERVKAPGPRDDLPGKMRN